MKKISCLAIMLFCLMFSAVAVVSYPTYLGGDRKLILCGGHMGVGWYLDKSSLVVQKYDPPVYRIVVNILMIEDDDRGNTNPYRLATNNFIYNWDDRKMYHLTNNNAWNYIPPIASMAETGHEFSREMAFYIIDHIKFYGGKKWYDSYFGKYIEPNCGTQIYVAVDGAE